MAIQLTYSGEEESSKRVDMFIITSDRCWRDRYKRADEELHLRRQQISRRTENQIESNHIKKVFDHIGTALDSLADASYIGVRRYLSSYLLLTNARRGGEVHRLTLEQCKEELDGFLIEKKSN